MSAAELLRTVTSCIASQDMTAREQNTALARVLDEQLEEQQALVVPTANGHAENGHAKGPSLEQAVYGAQPHHLSTPFC